jgi:hypothetical protein
MCEGGEVTLRNPPIAAVWDTVPRLESLQSTASRKSG